MKRLHLNLAALWNSRMECSRFIRSRTSLRAFAQKLSLLSQCGLLCSHPNVFLVGRLLGHVLTQLLIDRLSPFGDRNETGDHRSKESSIGSLAWVQTAAQVLLWNLGDHVTSLSAIGSMPSTAFPQSKLQYQTKLQVRPAAPLPALPGAAGAEHPGCAPPPEGSSPAMELHSCPLPQPATSPLLCQHGAVPVCTSPYDTGAAAA